MNLTHTFITKSHGLKDLFNEKVNTLSKFMRSLEKQSKIDPLRYDTQKYLGDGFEFFIEMLLHLHPVDNRLGVYNYKPILMNDNGVDGVGVNIRGEKSVVQIKYRSNTKTVLTATNDHLSNLLSDGMLAHNVISDNEDSNNYRHFVFTTAKGLHFYTDSEMYKSKIRCVGYDELKSLVDNNVIFWEKVREIVNSLEKDLVGKE